METKYIDKALDLLSCSSDDERKRMADWYYPTIMTVYGVKSARLKAIALEIRKDLRGVTAELVIDLCKQLAGNGIFESQLLAYSILNRNYKLISLLSVEDILSLGSYMDNWVSTDSFSTQIAGPAWRLGPLGDEIIKEWACSKDRWWRRNALVATVGLNLRSQGGTGDADRTMIICEMLIDDKDDMVIKAMSWALRELSKHQKEPVEKFLSFYGDRVASRVKREVNKKLKTGRKNG